MVRIFLSAGGRSALQDVIAAGNEPSDDEAVEPVAADELLSTRSGLRNVDEDVAGASEGVEGTIDLGDFLDLGD